MGLLQFFRSLGAKSYYDEFGRSIRQYWDERLARELGAARLPPPIKVAKRRQTFVVETRTGKAVAKFYYRKHSEAARQIAAERLLAEAGVATPRVIFHDGTEAAEGRGGLRVAVQEFIEGRAFDPTTDGAILPRVAELIGRVHGCLNAGFDRPDAPRSGNFWDEFVLGRLRPRLDRITATGIAESEAEATEARDWFESWREGLMEGLCGHSLAHMDLSPQNVLLTADGRPHLIDLDLCAFAVPGFDLIRFPAKFILTRAEWGGIKGAGEFWARCGGRLDGALRAYFALMPEGAERNWGRTRDFYLAWNMLGRVDSLTENFSKSEERAATRGEWDRISEGAQRDAAAGIGTRELKRKMRAKAKEQWRNLLRVIGRKP